MKKYYLYIGIVFIVFIVGLFWGYQKYASPTRIAFVNYPEYVIAPLLAQEIPDSIHIDVLKWSDKSGVELSKYDMVIFFGMGLNFTESQQKLLAKLKVPIFVNASTRSETAIDTLAEEKSLELQQYLRYGGRKNFFNMCNYIRQKIDGKCFYNIAIEAPQKVLTSGFFHRNQEKMYSSYMEYQKNIQQIADAPVVAILSGNGFGDIALLFDKLMSYKINVVGIAGMGNSLELLKQVKPDLIINFPHGRLSMQAPEKTIEYLHKANIPLLTPIRVDQLYEDFLKDQRGMTGGMLSQSIIMPELDGAQAPYVLFALYRNSRGLSEYRLIPERVELFANLVNKTLLLKSKDNAEKKIAIIYYKEPGKNALIAGGLEVGHSLFNTLHYLKLNGYNTGELPTTVEELHLMIQQQGAVFGSYAQGAQSEFNERALISISRENFTAWSHLAILPELQDEVKKSHGEFPEVLKLGGLRFGNILLMPQTAAGTGSDENSVVHGVKQIPPYPYISTYLYVRYGFEADALLHFGTHGSLEFTPWKQVALSGFDWSDVLISGIPHYYLYVINNVGEALIAKRRSYATIVSHLTAPFMNAESSGELAELGRKIDDYENTESALLKAEYAKSILNLTKSLNLDKELNIQDELNSELIEAIHNYIHEVENSKVHRGLYVIGRAYSEENAAETASLMLSDSVDKEREDMGQNTTQAELNTMLESGTLPDGRPMPDEMKKALSTIKNVPETTIAKPQKYEDEFPKLKAQLLQSTQDELSALLNAFSGGYILPSSGGDPISNPDAVPTGHNLFGVDPDRMPTRESWNVGVQLGEALIAENLKIQGRYPQKVAFSLWGGEFIRTQGTNIAEIFYLLGVEPVWDSRQRVVDIRLIPSAKLKRPRIDVIIQTSGQFRGAATSRMRLIDKAIRMAAADKQSENGNFVREGSLAIARALIEQGMAPERAKTLADARIFGGVNGNFGTGVTGKIQSGDSWDDTKQLADMYINNMGTLYTESHWGEHVDGLFKATLSGTDTVVQSRSSNSWGPLSLDHVYEFTGGISMAVESVNGKLPAAYFNDLRTPGKARIQEVGQAAMVEARSTLLNPKYLEAMLKEGPTAAGNFADAFRNTYGWEVTRPGMIDDYLWEEYKEVYIDDKLNLGVREFFESQNPYALQEMTGVMLETIRKGYWEASEETIKELSELHVELVNKYEPGCSTYVCDNSKLREMIAKNVADSQNYKQAIEKIRSNGSGKIEEVTGQTLKEETINLIREDETRDRSLLVLGIIITLGLVVLFVSRKRTKGIES